MGSNVPEGDAVVPNWLAPKAITCLSLGDTSIDSIVVGVEFVAPDTFTARKGVTDASVSKK